MAQRFLRVSVSPHIHSPVTTQRLMGDVCLALLPALLFSFWVFGYRAFLLTAVSVASCVIFEGLSRKLMKRPQTVQDLSAVVTGLLLAFCLPANLPLYMVVVGAFVAIVVAKQFFGGIGMNFVNPALIGRIALSVSFAKEVAGVAPLTESAKRVAESFLQVSSDGSSAATWAADVVSSATPMQLLNGLTSSGSLEKLDHLTLPDWQGAILGIHSGALGEVSVVCLLLGFAYLLYRRVISWHIPVIYVATTAILMYLYSGFNLNYALLATLSGGLVMGAIFMATDYTTSPAPLKGKVIYALGCGFLTATIRYFGALPEATAFSIVLMNLLVPYLNGWTKPVPFGGTKPTWKRRRQARQAAAQAKQA